jgi:acyl carrier protein
MIMNEQKLKEVIADIFDIEEDEISEEMTSDTFEKWDSLNHLRLVTALEGEFDISFTMDEINTMKSYPNIVELVMTHSKGK